MARVVPHPPIELRFAATREEFAHAFAELRRRLADGALRPLARHQVELVFEELVANLVRHGGRGGGPPPGVAVSLEFVRDAVVLTVDDDGPPFDPSRQHEHRARGPLAEAEVGGLGLVIVRHAARAIAHDRTQQGTNRVVVTIAADD